MEKRSKKVKIKLDLYGISVLYLGEMREREKMKNSKNEKKKRVIDSFPFYKNLFNHNKKGKK